MFHWAIKLTEFRANQLSAFDSSVPLTYSERVEDEACATD